MVKQNKIFRILRKSNRIIKMLQFMLLRDKKAGNNLNSYQVTALDNYRESMMAAYEELIKSLK